MILYIYIDCENVSNLTILPQIPNARFFVFLGAKQSDNIKSVQGIRVKKIRLEKIAHNLLDCTIIDYILKRRNLKNTTHYIISKDKGYDCWIDYINSTQHDEIVKRVEKFDSISK